MPNRLATQSSKYLLKHKNNPVDWWPWSQEAFEQAKLENKPVFISIGYFTCHWCSVMERESFEDHKTAEFLNEHFISIKVDREEHPDVDKIYQRYYNSLTGQSGGWPLSIWAFPDGLPFFIGTYFPKSFNLRTKTFMAINKEILESWETEQDDLYKTAIGLSRNFDTSNQIMFSSKNQLSDNLYINEILELKKRFDLRNGGFDRAPKFPRFASLRFLLAEGHLRNNSELINFVRFTLHQMGKGGIYDQLGGGIARYATDDQWLIPHFEKMLYDNAGFLQVAAETYTLTKDPFVEYLILDTVAFIARELRGSKGSFYSAIDAESEGVEGKFYVWDIEQLKEALDDDTKVAIAKVRYGISRRGNFKDPHSLIKRSSVLSIQKSVDQIGNELKLDSEEILNHLNYIKQLLFEKRSQRTQPSVDTKSVTAWNAMICSSLISVAKSLGYDQAVDLAIPALERMLKYMVNDIHILRVSHEDNQVSTIPGVLDDYAFLIEALINYYEYSGDFEYLSLARKLVELTIGKFYVEEDGVFYFNEIQEGTSLGRIFSGMDDTFASSSSVMISNLYKIGKYFEESALVHMGQDIVTKLIEFSSEYSAAMNEFLSAARFYLGDPVEIVIVNDDGTFKDQINRMYIPNSLVYHHSKETQHLEVFKDRVKGSEPTVYICRGMTCSMPITTFEALQTEPLLA